MRIRRITPRSGISRRSRLIAIGTGLVAAAAIAMPNASAADATPFSASELSAASNSVLAADVAGTSWAVDPNTDRVVVTVDSRVTKDQIAKIKEQAGDKAGALTIKHTQGRFTPLITGGDAIYGGGYRCSLGFNVHSGSTYYFLTAGHCGAVASTWYSNSSQSTVLGTTQSYTFPGSADYALVKYTNSSVAHPSAVGSQSITSAATPAVGATVYRRGSTTGTHSGKVTALNATVNYGSDGIVRGLIQTTVCAEPGDSGGPLYNGTVAYGLTSGGSGDCTSGGTTFFQPVTAALSHYGVSVG